MAYPKLLITVTLTEFKVLATDTPRFCAATTTVISGSGVGNGHRSRPHQIQVKGKKKPVDLVLTIANGIGGSTEVFWPAGIAFIGAPSNTDPTGGYNFSKATCAGGCANRDGQEHDSRPRRRRAGGGSLSDGDAVERFGDGRH